MVDLFRYRHWDLVSKRWIYFTLSGLLILAGIIALCTQGLNEGIDFTGGGLVAYRVTQHIPTAVGDPLIGEIRTELESKKVENQVQISPSAMGSKLGDLIIIRTKLDESKGNANAIFTDQIKNDILPVVLDVTAKNHLTLANVQTPKVDASAPPVTANATPPATGAAATTTPASAKDAQPATTTATPAAAAPATGDQTATVVKPEQQEMVTVTTLRELAANSIGAVVLGSVLILFWILIRYNIGGFGFRYAAGGILALLHDLMILTGMFAIFHGLQVNSPFIAAWLTVLGYSIHDTIVIYDRIRENMRLRKGRTFAETVNISLLETMARSVNTVLTVLFTLLALLFLGGPTLRDFVAALLIGVVVGAYSSIFIASQLLVTWSKGKGSGNPALR